MASKGYSYPSDLDSDGGDDSDQYSDNSDVSDTDSLTTDLSFKIGSSLRNGARPRPRPSGPPAGMCIVCGVRPPYVNLKTGRSYPTCGLKCAAAAEQGTRAPAGRWDVHSLPRRSGSPRWDVRGRDRHSSDNSRAGHLGMGAHVQPMLLCVVCKVHRTHRQYVTCGLKCAEKLCKDGGDPTMCDYCHRKPRGAGSNQCDSGCAAKAKMACLLCKCRPKNGVGYHLCGKNCRRVATMSTPLLLEAPGGHKTYEMVEKRFQKAWHSGTAPTIKRIFKIIENDEFLRPYAEYKKLKGNERFRYHGTRRECQLGTSTTQLCASATCPICNILKTSFNLSFARNGCFGAGIYSSSSASKAFGYMGGNGCLLLTKVVVGQAWNVQKQGHATSPAAGYDSVVHDDNGPANETIVYKNEAIRPVFLVMLQ